MKIAVAFFGLPRCTPSAVPTIEKNIFNQFPAGSSVKCFYHFYQQTEVVNSRSGENGSLDPENYAPFERYEGILENPQEVLKVLPYDKLKEFGDSWNDNFQSLRNLLLQLHSLRQVTKLVKEFNPDVVVFARPDLVYHDSIPTHVFSMIKSMPKAAFIPNWQWGKGLNDTFSVCGAEIFAAYGSRLDEVFNFCLSQKGSLHSERLLKFALLKQDADIYHLDVKASRVRIGGVVVQEKYKSHSSLFGPITNSNKRFVFLTGLKTKIKTYLFLKFKSDKVSQ